MNEYKIIKPEGVTVGDNAESHAQGSIVAMDPEIEETKGLLADGSIVQVEATRDDNGLPTETLSTKGDFQFEVNFKDATTQEEKEACLPWINECTTALAGDDVSVPQCVESFTVRRIKI